MSILRSIPWVPLLVRACLHDAHEVGWCNTLESKTDGDTSGVHDVGSSKSMGSYRSCSCIQSYHSDMHIGLRLVSMFEDRGCWCYPSLRCLPWLRYSQRISRRHHGRVCLLLEKSLYDNLGNGSTPWSLQTDILSPLIFLSMAVPLGFHSGWAKKNLDIISVSSTTSLDLVTTGYTCWEARSVNRWAYTNPPAPILWRKKASTTNCWPGSYGVSDLT